jgi:hypothetical protein
MKKLFAAAAVAGLVGSVNAQSAFEGAYGQIGVGNDSNRLGSYTASASGDAVPVTSADSGSFATVIGLGYNFSISKTFLLGIGADYGVIPSSTFNAQTPTTPLKNEISNRYNIFLSPGYIINKDALVYAKAGYSSQTINITDLAAGVTFGNTVGKGNANGYILGLGYKQMIKGGFYGFAEGNFYDYSSLTSGNKTLASGVVASNVNPKSSAYQFLVGVGYKF